jgi:phosphopantothenate-cysteine ligase
MSRSTGTSEGRSADVAPDVAPEDEYFRSNPPPASLRTHADLASSFVNRHASEGRRVVLVTSGGTTVPLENQTVRFIDNFSAGTRGATSAEYFLDAGYAVIFLHRRFSLLPYSRHFSHSTNCFLDFMDTDEAGNVLVRDQYQSQMKTVLDKWSAVKRTDALLVLPFVSITDYLWLLRETAMLMKPLGPSALFYLAAAVSDFFIPSSRMAEHKIQSGKIDGHVADHSHPQANKLVIDLDPVPKFLKTLVDDWAPGAMIVSFKLETDPALLLSKAQGALLRYNHQLVVGNLLSTRAWEVMFVEPGQKERWVRLPKQTSDAVDGLEIESLIVPEVASLHEKHTKQRDAGRT